ncbi:hypothetical protein B9G98_03371 [Wickerhamiella sorbophila]|uniref:Uncharacterized protein n=1 Tax=Wickerhamiella sorbophila TaxID=45607 RepID=A0A2T0FL86_9ASCO|nr:hypothetical protein B9G98_03371 [Wickerhamiella sorbophila]PRT55751.1 hypothetical protein B9G98_03371 [Wickerhamiella sorbophila]
MVKRVIRKRPKAVKRELIQDAMVPSPKRLKPSSESCKAPVALPTPDDEVATEGFGNSADDSKFIAELEMDDKEIVQDPLPMPEDPLDKVARVLAAGWPNGNDDEASFGNDIDIEDDLGTLTDDDEVLIDSPSHAAAKRWPLDESPEALTFSVLNASSSSSSSCQNTPAFRSDNGSSEFAPSASDEQAPGLEIDDFIDYDSCSSDDNESGVASPSSEDSTSTRRAPVFNTSLPLYFYRERPEEEIPWLSEVDFKATDVLAAWSSVAPGIDPCAKASYIRNVVFAAASLNPTSMASGRARQTMAPPISLTVDF